MGMVRGYIPGEILKSISSTFHAQIFLYKSALRSFSVVRFWLCIFWHKNIGTKSTPNKLMKLTLGRKK